MFNLEQIANLVVTHAVGFILSVLTFAIVIVLGWLIAKFVSKLLFKLLIKGQTDLAAARFISSVVKVIIIIVAVITAIGNNMSSFVAAIGAAGLTASFALQGSLSNFISGMQLIFSKPFKTNDYLTVGAHSGAVKEITILNTTLITIDNKEVIIPNSKMTTEAIVNYTAQETRRLDLSYSVSYSIDTQIPKDVIADVIAKNAKLLQDPKPIIAVGDHKDSSVEILAKVWVKGEDYWDMYFYMQEEVKKQFDLNNVEIPFPQIDVHSK